MEREEESRGGKEVQGRNWEGRGEEGGREKMRGKDRQKRKEGEKRREEKGRGRREMDG